MDLMLKGKRVLVTGSSRGIGLAIAKRFVQEGADVVVAGRNRDELDAAVQALNAEGGGSARGVSADLASEDGPAALVEAARLGNGGIDILVGNTGGPPLPLKDFINTTRESWTAAYNVQLGSVVRLFRAAVPVLRETGRDPAIVVVSSASVREPMPHHIQSTVYRAAVANMCKHLAHNYPELGIRVNIVSPLSIRTERLASHMDLSARVLKTPMRRLGDVSEFAAAVVFAAAPVSAFMHGVHFNVDGGYVSSSWW